MNKLFVISFMSGLLSENTIFAIRGNNISLREIKFKKK